MAYYLRKTYRWLQLPCGMGHSNGSACGSALPILIQTWLNQYCFPAAKSFYRQLNGTSELILSYPLTRTNKSLPFHQTLSTVLIRLTCSSQLKSAIKGTVIENLEIYHLQQCMILTGHMRVKLRKWMIFSETSSLICIHNQFWKILNNLLKDDFLK